MVNKPDKKIRQMSGKGVEDPVNIANLTFNEASGGQKNLQVGPFLKPITQNGAFTTDATTAKSVRKGSALAIYNNSGSLGSITMGDDSTIAALVSGVTDVNGNVGIPCKANEWTYVNTNQKQWIRTSAPTLLVFIIEDETYISSQKQG